MNKRVTTMGLALAVLLIAGATHAALTDGLELYSSMDTATPYLPAAYWEDVSGNDHFAQTNPTGIDGSLLLGGTNRGTAADFSGGTLRMTVNDGLNTDFDPGTGDFSVSLWYYETTIDSYGYILGKGNCGSSSVPGFNLASQNGQPLIRVEDVASSDDHLSIKANTGDISAAGWHHLVAVFDRTGTYSAANTVSLYVDNQYTNSIVLPDIFPNSYNMANPDYAFMLGGQPTSSDHDFEGYLDDVAIYRGALSTSDVNTLYTAATLDASTVTTAGVSPVMIHNFVTNRNQDTAPGLIPDDYQGNYNGGLYGPAASVVHDAGRGDNVIDLPGETTSADEYLSYGKVLDIDADTSFSASVWFKVENSVAADHGAQVIAQDYKGNVGWNMYCYAPSPDEARPNGSISCYVWDDSGTSERAKLTFQASDGEGGFNDFLNDGDWHHFVMTFDSTENKIRGYIDGLRSGDAGDENGWFPNLVNTTGEGSLTNDNFFRLGCNYAKDKEFDGKLDDFAFWTRVLTDAEVAAIYGGADIVSPTTIPGDADNDQDVDSDDAEIMAGNWGMTEVTGGAAMGDFNGDGNIDMLDASILAAAWTGPLSETGGQATVPEPATLILLGIGSLMLAIGRRR